MTFVATVAAILYAGATPVLADIDPRTRNLDPAMAARAVTGRTRAIVPVHLHGAPAAMDELTTLADAHGLVVIEDAAQAHGAEYKGRRVGSIGDLGCFSFYPGKNLGACGEGGAIVTDSADLGRGSAPACGTGARARSIGTRSRASTTGWTRSRRPACG